MPAITKPLMFSKLQSSATIRQRVWCCSKRRRIYSEDQGGNQDAPTPSQTIKIDTTKPTLTFGAPAPAANGNGWNNTAMDITYTIGDNLSGVVSSTPASALHFGSAGANQSVAVTVTDEAGNSATLTSPPVNIDLTAPTLTFGAPSPAANANGWNKTAVDLDYNTADNLSGVASSTPASVLHFTTEGAGQTAAGSRSCPRSAALGAARSREVKPKRPLSTHDRNRWVPFRNSVWAWRSAALLSLR
jgi:hypothetical protein